MRIGRERRGQRSAVAKLAGIDVDHSLGHLVPGTVAGGLRTVQLRRKPFLASMSSKVINQLMHSLAPEAEV